MTLFAGLKVSTLGLNAQGTKMGAISDNIANVNTVGYKRTDVQFSTLVTERIRETRFTPGGVTARPRQTVDQAGQLLSTGLQTDFAVSGRGMFIVTEEATFTPQTSSDGLAYTRAGSFRPDENGFLRNTAGYFLQGWTVNRNGDVTLDGTNAATIIDSPTFSNLQPVNVNRFSNIAEQTENLRSRLNLPADFNVTSALDEPVLDRAFSFTLSTGAAVAGTDLINDNDGTANTTDAFSDINVSVRFPAPANGNLTGGTQNALTITAAELTAAGFDPTTGSNTVSNFLSAINSITKTLATGETVDFSASLSTGGNIVINATADGAATLVESFNTAAGTLSVVDPALAAETGFTGFGFNGHTNAGAAAATTQISSVVRYSPDAADGVVTSANRIDLPANQFVLTIDNEAITFPLTGDFTTPTNTLGDLTAQLNAASVTQNGSTFTLRARIAEDGGLVVTALRDGARAQITANAQTVDFFDSTGAAGGAAINPAAANLFEFEGVNSNFTAAFGAFDTANERRAQLDDIIATGGNADFTTVTTVFDALGQPHQVTMSYYRYTSDTSGSNTWAVRMTDSSIDGVKTPLTGITDADATVDTAATVPRFLTYVGNDGNDTVDAERITQSQTLFLSFTDGDGALSGVFTDPLLSAGSRIATRTTDPNEALKMIQIAVGEVDIATTGAAGSRTDDTLAVARTTDAAGNPVRSPFGTDGAQALVFDWDIGRPTGVRTAAPTTTLNTTFAGTGLDGITQFDSGEATPTLETFFTSQDGLRAGVLTGVQLDDDGTLNAFFDNGAQRSIYKIPLVSFVNFNGLINESGNIYRESQDSGAAQINAAGQGFNGDLVGGVLEQSNVELSDEFTEMIITQQSFTANTRAITTTDEMLTDINNMVR